MEAAARGDKPLQDFLFCFRGGVFPLLVPVVGKETEMVDGQEAVKSTKPNEVMLRPIHRADVILINGGH